jgi:glyoxylase-like metal-dependent hydrolase (beta-lactamase superfamily II)
MLSDRVGAPIIGCAPLSLETVGPRADAAFDGDYSPDRILSDGEALDLGGERLTAVATPGHTSNHLCFAYRGALFTGDHVMGWSTTVVVPPDGDMADYMASLDKLLRREDRIYYPAHGDPVTEPIASVQNLVDHRRNRERQILETVEAPSTVAEIVDSVYAGLDPRLHSAAAGSVTAHLIDLERRGMVLQSGERWKIA